MATLASENKSTQNLWHWFKGSWTDRLLLLITLIGIFYAWQWIHAEIGSGPPLVMIYHDDKLLARYPFPQAGEEAIHFHAEGEIGTSEIVIGPDGVHFLHSPCTTQYCVSRGERKKHGDIIACVPNRILIAIEGARSGYEGLDAIVE
ncbi:MAG: NusG domain II-containing protein [Mariprofundaceae bacterium]